MAVKRKPTRRFKPPPTSQSGGAWSARVSAAAAGGSLSLALMAPAVRMIQHGDPAIAERIVRRTRAILERAQIDVRVLGNPDGRLPRHVVAELSDLVHQVTGDPAFSLRAATRAEPGDLELYEYVMRTCNTLGEHLELAARYLPLLDDASHSELTRDGRHAIWTYRTPPDVQVPPATNETAMIWGTLNARRCTGIALVPVEVRFAHAQPRYAAEYTRFFRSRVVFGADCNASVMLLDALRLPFRTADPVLHRILRRQADAALAALPAGDPFEQRVRALIESELPRGAADLTTIARKVHTSVSTLRRRLNASGIGFGALVEDVRKTAVRRHLDDRDLTLAEIALRAGFAHEPAFHRAFKRWYGQTPAQVRRMRPRHIVSDLLARPRR
jgi:AraC-like DNA-binding protein